MAKQTFTTGQVLTAAQMTSLQETAMGGGPATAKTASYVLVAADAGTTVAMNAAGATTITVNTGLFAAGDTVFIQNLGAGACTVTAGTATVATAGSLILPQNDAGILYFTSASAAIFYDYIQVGAASPLTTKGDLYTFGTSDTRLGVGANGTTLTADSSEATGLKWATPASGGGMTLLSTTTLSGASTTISSISGSHKNLLFVISGVNISTNAQFYLQSNGSAGDWYEIYGEAGGTAWTENNGNDLYPTAASLLGSNTENAFAVLIYNYASTTAYKPFNLTGTYKNSSSANRNHFSGGTWRNNTAISSMKFSTGAGSFNGGTVLTYGVS
jgi:hypothetical protein